jgi:hypothetical protein
MIGKPRVPEIVGSLTFDRLKRNRLVILGTTSLEAVYIVTNGAWISFACLLSTRGQGCH